MRHQNPFEREKINKKVKFWQQHISVVTVVVGLVHSAVKVNDVVENTTKFCATRPVAAGGQRSERADLITEPQMTAHNQGRQE